METVKKIALSWLRTFVVAVLGQVIVLGSSVLDFTGSDWKVVLAAGIAALIKVIYNWFDSNYSDYGLTN